MYTLLRAVSTRDLLFQQLPTLGGSFLIAEAFYKFGSFGLEALAFLATWLVLDALVQTVDGVVSRAASGTARPTGLGTDPALDDAPIGGRTTDAATFDHDTEPEQPDRSEIP